MNGPLQGKTVLITGSSIGIGRETAIAFAKEGCRVAITYYKDEEEARRTARDCGDEGREARVFYLDVTDNESIRTCLEDVLRDLDALDILVNNASVIVWNQLADQSLEDIEVQLRTDLEGTIKMTKVALPNIRETIINVSSGASLGYQTLAIYSAAKAGVDAFSRALSKELGEIDVFVVHPGMTATRMTDFRGEPPESVARTIVDIAKGAFDVSSGDVIRVRDPPPRKKIREFAGATSTIS